jgi:GntR family transcriptional regulator
MSADLAGGSLHETLRQAGFVLRRGSGTISASAATSAEGRLLEIRAGDPLLVEQRVIEDTHGRRIEATESRYAASRYALEVRFDVEGPERDTTAPA